MSAASLNPFSGMSTALAWRDRILDFGRTIRRCQFVHAPTRASESRCEADACTVGQPSDDLPAVYNARKPQAAFNFP